MVDEDKTAKPKKAAAKKTTKTDSAAKTAPKKAAKKTPAKKAAAKPAAKAASGAKKTTPAKKAATAKKAPAKKASPKPEAKKTEPVVTNKVPAGVPEPREVKAAIANAEAAARALPATAKEKALGARETGADLTKQLENLVGEVKANFATNRRKKGTAGALMLTPQFVVDKAVKAATVTVGEVRKTAEAQAKRLKQR